MGLENSSIEILYNHKAWSNQERWAITYLADKLDNAQVILRDVRGVGSALWERFSVNDPQQHLWYYRSLFEVYERRNHTWMVAELRRVLDDLGAEINASAQR